MPTSENAGDFTCAALVKVMVSIDKAWRDNQTNQDFVSYVGVLEAVRSKQTATMPDLENTEKDQTVKVYWATDCNTSLADCADDCTVGGPELEAKCKEYTLDICKKAGFTVREKAFRASKLSREEVVAKGMLKRMKELDEYLAQTMVAKLNSFAGVNKFEGIGSVAGSGTTYISASFWTPDITGYFTQVAIMNKLSGAYMIHGTNLWQTNWLSQMNNLNQDQKDQMAKMQAIQQFWDPFNIDSVNTPDKVSYMVTSGAVVFINKAYYPTSPVEYLGAGQIRYSVASKTLPGVMYDVVYTNRCVANEIYHDWTLYVTAGIFSNPYGCDEDVTGVLKFVCGENDES